MSSPKKDDQIRRAQLQVQFHSTRREDFQTIEAYVEKLKSVANSLAEMDSQISDSDMVLQLLAGLPTQYSLLKNKISSKRPLPNFENACSMLYMQEDILQDRDGEQNASDPGNGDAKQSSAFFTKDKFCAAMDTLRTVASAAGAVGAICAVAAPLGITAAGAVGSVAASRMIVAGAVGAITVAAGWKFWQTLPPKQHDV